MQGRNPHILLFFLVAFNFSSMSRKTSLLKGFAARATLLVYYPQVNVRRKIRREKQTKTKQPGMSPLQVISSGFDFTLQST